MAVTEQSSVAAPVQHIDALLQLTAQQIRFYEENVSIKLNGMLAP